MNYPGFLLYSALLFGGATYAEYQGWSFTKVNQVNDVPKTIRDNPGAYRSHYSYYPRYTGGK
jgi:hypothetical protein